METQNLDLLATKADIVCVLEKLEALKAPATPETPMPENPALRSLENRLTAIERASRAAVGLGLEDVPIDAQTAAAITGLAVNTVKKYGSYRALPTVKIGKKLQYSLKGCIQLIKAGSRKAAIDCTSDITGYHRKKRKQKGKASTTAHLIVAP